MLLINMFKGSMVCVCVRVCVMPAALEVDGELVSPGTACTAACGSVVSMVCTVNNCTSSLLTDLTVQLLSVEVLQSCTSITLKSNATDRHAVFDDSAVAIGCLMSTFPQVHPTEYFWISLHVTVLDFIAGIYQY